MNKVVIVFAVHPDDETLGAGGTLLRHVAESDEVHWVICTEITKENGFNEQTIANRALEIEGVSKLYGFKSVSQLGISSTRADELSMSNLVSRISKVVSEIEPSVVYLPFKDDVHSDHRVIFDAAYSCVKSFRYPSVKEVYMMETLSETEFSPSTKETSFVPNTFVDISIYLDKKMEVMNIFESELGEHPFPRSLRGIEALSVVRGATAGCEYAEAFMMLKKVR